MKTNNLAFLNNHFKYQYLELNNCASTYKQFEDYYKEQTKDYKYGIGIKELATDKILVLGLADEIGYDDLFENLITQLPNLSLQNVLMIFALITCKQPKTFNPFLKQVNYPSQFASELLSETNGYVLFRYQLMQLLSSCLPADENNTKQIEIYVRQYNLFNEFENFNNKLIDNEPS